MHLLPKGKDIKKKVNLGFCMETCKSFHGPVYLRHFGKCH